MIIISRCKLIMPRPEHVCLGFIHQKTVCYTFCFKLPPTGGVAALHDRHNVYGVVTGSWLEAVETLLLVLLTARQNSCI
jgi:hypothetical protein